MKGMEFLIHDRHDCRDRHDRRGVLFGHRGDRVKVAVDSTIATMSEYGTTGDFSSHDWGAGNWALTGWVHSCGHNWQLQFPPLGSR
eukprot:gene16605-biopygen12309